MPFTDSFLLSTEDDLTVESNGFLDLNHKTDQSDNPQTTIFYLGSALESPIERVLQATSDPGVDDIIISVVDILPVWQTAHAYVVGDCVQPTGGGNGKRYRCSVSGTSHASTEPTWPTTGIGTTVTDGTCTWVFVGAKHEIEEVELSTDGISFGAPGASLNLGPEVESGVGNLVEIHVRVNSEVLNVSNNVSTPEIRIAINNVTEFEA